jgi:sugar lactone lactonase YvrE
LRKNIGVILVGVLIVSSMLAGCAGKAGTVVTPLATGEAETFATGFRGSDGIAFDNLGHMYVGNRGDNTITVVQPGGKSQEFARLDCKQVLCMTTDKENNLLVAGKDKLFKISPKGKVQVLADGFTCADDLRLDQNGVIYMTDSFANRVYRITSSGAKTVVLENQLERLLPAKWYLTGIEFSPDYKHLYLASMQEGRVWRYAVSQDGGLASPEIVAEVPRPDHLAVDADGNLYVSLFGDGKLIRVSKDGKPEVLADSGDGIATPTGIAFGGPGFDPKSIYIADYSGNKVIRVSVGIPGAR